MRTEELINHLENHKKQMQDQIHDLNLLIKQCERVIEIVKEDAPKSKEISAKVIFNRAGHRRTMLKIE